MVISIYKFLSEYYGIILDAGIKCTHTIAKKNFRFLKGCPFKYAERNVDLVKTGKIIYVADSSGLIYPYICPNIIKTINRTCDYTAKPKESNDSDNLLDRLESLPTYIVHELLSKYKDRPSFYRIIKKELINRGVYEDKKYKLRKENLEIDSGEDNDKYQRRRKIKCKKS